MTKLDYLLIIIIMIIALCLFSISQIIGNKEALNYFVKLGVLDNSKETIKTIILTFYSLLGTLFILLGTVFVRILLRLFKK